MKVLIADFDLFSKTGGGQTFYRNLIKNNPEIDFYYFTVLESADIVRPDNACGIAYQEKYFIEYLEKFYDVNPPKWTYGTFVRVSNMAASVAGHHFDVVDLPDYEQFGTLLPSALRYHNVEFERIVLSMHGRISTSIQLNWSTEGKIDISLDLQEQMQYSSVDIRYGISQSYLDEWRTIIDIESHYLNPLSFISKPEPRLAEPATEPPSLNFIGRTEKRKSPDIFVDLVWWLPPSSFSTANIIGPDCYDYRGVGSQLYLYSIKNNRFKDIRILPAMNQRELSHLFASKSVTFLPSRYDTLNLLALESLFSGCPTAIGSGAGVCRFLQENFPQVPLMIIDIKSIYSCLTPILSALKNYEDYRQQLVEALLSSSFNIPDVGLEQVYKSDPIYDFAIRSELERWYSQLMSFHNTASLSNDFKLNTLKFVKSKTPIRLRKKLRQYKEDLKIDNIKKIIKEKIVYGTISTDLHLTNQLLKSRGLFEQYKEFLSCPEETEKHLNKKVQKSWEISSNFRVDRVRIWRETARLERMRGNDLIATTYQTRAMRLLGGDFFGELPAVVRSLRVNGFLQEAMAVEAMYGNSAQQEERCAALLEQAVQNHKNKPSGEYELFDDRRELSAYRVSVIVSLYNAAAKLPLFLQTLQNQTLVKAGAVEVILIDSGSPADEYNVFQQMSTSLDIPIVYARSAQRETIQSAWNRGISLSRSPYLTFLGVDEGILPNCLEILAAELDADQTLDWVQGNSLVTNVDKYGTLVNDIMVYDRKGYQQDLVYLETCYLSWVGALYRRSIHDRFGYYDASFTAAGDTEFKNRVLPLIKTKSLPQTLGVFWNYPEERTTQHPRAEIEDLRAWYLHRTLAGVKYAFANRNPRDAEELLYSCLRYRKSYCQHWSTDIEYAYNLGAFLQEKVPDSPALKYFDGIKKLLELYRGLDWIPTLSRLAPTSAMIRTIRVGTEVERHHRTLGNQLVEPMYKTFNDNRHEQHAYLWLTDI